MCVPVQGCVTAESRDRKEFCRLCKIAINFFSKPHQKNGLAGIFLIWHTWRKILTECEQYFKIYFILTNIQKTPTYLRIWKRGIFHCSSTIFWPWWGQWYDNFNRVKRQTQQTLKVEAHICCSLSSLDFGICWKSSCTTLWGKTQS